MKKFQTFFKLLLINVLLTFKSKIDIIKFTKRCQVENITKTIIICDRDKLENLALLIDDSAGGKPYNQRTENELWNLILNRVADLLAMESEINRKNYLERQK
jgi:hypothetical protein